MGERATAEGGACFIGQGACPTQRNLQGCTKYIFHSFRCALIDIRPVPPATEIPSLGPAIERFQRSLTALSDSHALNNGSITSLAEQRAELDTRETELRSMIAIAESKRSWFTEFKDWVESVATFLDEKVALIFLQYHTTDSAFTVSQARKTRRGTPFNTERTSRDHRPAAPCR